MRPAKAREYLASRGLGEEVLRAFGVGYAPSAWDQVLTRGQRAGFSVAELAAAGLIQKGRKGGHYDRFRARIMFPVRDGRGRVQGFGARALRPDSKPKYLNSPEGELYRKSRTLYGIDRARSAIAKAGRAVVVEGYTDVLAAHQAGIEEAVAVMGTAITPEQLQQLSRTRGGGRSWRMDADRAGRAAMLRAQRVAGSREAAAAGRGDARGRGPRGHARRRGRRSGSKGLIEEAMELPEFHVRAGARRGRPVVAGRAGIGRSTRSCRCWRRWGSRSAATSWRGWSPIGWTPIRAWLCGGSQAKQRSPAAPPAPCVAPKPRGWRRAAPAGAATVAERARAPRAGAAGDVHRVAGGGAASSWSG